MAWAWTGVGGHLVSYDPPFAVGSAQTYVRVVPANWCSDFRFAWQGTRPRTRRGPRPHLAATHPRDWSGSWNGKLHGTITTDGDRWLAYVRLEDPPGRQTRGGGEVTTPIGRPVSAEVPFPGPTSTRAGGTATSTPAAAVRRELSETQQRDDVMAPG
jgi:hypothetical protein